MKKLLISLLVITSLGCQTQNENYAKVFAVEQHSTSFIEVKVALKTNEGWNGDIIHFRDSVGKYKVGDTVWISNHR